MRFYLLGQFRVETDSDGVAVVELPRLRKTRALLAYLLLFREQTHARASLAALFWGEASEEKARASLATALKQLRPLLAASGAGLESDHFAVRLRLGNAWLDLAALDAGLANRADPATRAAALALYSGDLLAGWLDDWSITERESLRRRVLSSGTELLRFYLAAQRWDEGSTLARLLLAHEPLDETIHELLLRLLLAAGDYASARRQYQQFAALLRAELGVEPTATVRELYSAALRVGREAPPGELIAAESAANNPQQASFRLPFVGRRRERMLLWQALERLKRGTGGLILIRGEAGAGKTRLVEEALLAAAQLRLAHGRAYELDQDIPFSGLLTPLSNWLLEELAPRQVLTRLGLIGVATLAQLLPGLASRLPGLPPLPPLPAVEAHARLLQSVVSAILALAAPGAPAVLFLDDLHWANSYTLQALQQLAGRLNSAPLLLIGAYRAEDAPPGGALAQLVAGAQREELPLLDLQVLAAEDVRLAVEPRVPAASATLSDWLYHQSGGNPFYLAELLRSLQEEGRALADAASGGWRLVAAGALAAPDVNSPPPGVRDAVLQRFARLSAPAQVLTRAAAVLGDDGDFDLLAAVGGLREEEALEALEENLARRFLRQSGPSNSYTIAHDLLRQAIYSSLTPARRQRLHERSAAALEQAFANGAPATQTAALAMRLAYHYGQSSNSGKQRIYFRRAAEAARALYDNQLAQDYYRRLLPLLPPAEQPGVLLDLADLLYLLGGWDEAEALAAEALRLAEAAGDKAAQAHALVEWGTIARLRSRYGEALQLFERAQGLIGPAAADQTLRLRLLDALGTVQWMQNEYDAALATFNTQLALAEEADERVSKWQALNNLASVYIDREEYDLALDRQQQALAIAQDLGDQRAAAKILRGIGRCYNNQLQVRPALAALYRSWQLASEIGNRAELITIASNLGVSYLMYGAYELAFSWHAYHFLQTVALGKVYAANVALNNLGSCLLMRGAYAQAAEFWRRAITVQRQQNIPSLLTESLQGYAQVLEAQGRYAEALPLAVEAVECARHAAYRDYELRAMLLVALLQARLDTSALRELVARCLALLPDWPQAERQAAIHYTIWRIDPFAANERLVAAQLYEQLYSSAPLAEFRERYRELSGADLPAPPPLPPAPDEITPDATHLAVLLAAADALAAASS